MADSISYSDQGDQTLITLEKQLSDVQDAITAIIQGGQAYTLAGSRTVTRGSLGELKRERGRLERRIFLQKGYTGRNAPDFNTRRDPSDVDSD